MIPKPLSFRSSLRWFLFGTSIVIILLYTLLLGQFFAQGLRTATEVELSLLARDYETRLKNDPSALPSPSLNINYYLNWQDIPEPFQSHLSQDDLMEDEMEVVFGKAVEVQGESARELFFILPYRLYDGRMFYITRYLPAERLELDIMREFDPFYIFLRFTVGIVILLVVILATQLFYRYLNRRMNQLTDWTQDISLENLAEMAPDMGFQEFTDISGRLHEAYNQLKRVTKREKDFLNHASHELRTPIAVMRNNIELIQRNELPDELKNPIERIERAAHIMQSLTETLLWLSKGKNMQLSKKELDISQLLNEQIEVHRYLLREKDVEVKADLPEGGEKILIEVTPLAIVTANLIRNAFQHTYTGRVMVKCDSESITICNKSEQPGGNGNETDNYQIGLKLCQEICEALDWDLLMQPRQDEMNVILTFKS